MLIDQDTDFVHFLGELMARQFCFEIDVYLAFMETPWLVSGPNWSQ